VGGTEPQVQPWLRGAGQSARAVREVKAALAAMQEEPAELVIVDREPGDGRDVAGVCKVLREDDHFDEAWLLAITSKGRMADAALDQHNERLLTALQRDGRAYLSNAVVDGRFALRACITNFRTTRADVERTLALVRALGDRRARRGR